DTRAGSATRHGPAPAAGCVPTAPTTTWAPSSFLRRRRPDDVRPRYRGSPGVDAGGRHLIEQVEQSGHQAQIEQAVGQADCFLEVSPDLLISGLIRTSHRSSPR